MMRFFLCFSIVLAISGNTNSHNIIDVNWTTGNSILQTGNSQMAIGYWNNSIFFIGGYECYHICFQRYDVINNKFYISDTIPNNTVDIWGFGQYYTQINDNLYMVTASTFNVFNLNTKIFQNNWENVVLQTNVAIYACLASTSNYLFVLGGGTSSKYLRTFQILNISSKTWLETAPSMIESRGQFSCVVHPLSMDLYAIGGQLNNGFDGYLYTIEKINVGTNQMNNVANKWNYIDDNLSSAFSRSRAVIYSNYILVIGGSGSDGTTWYFVDRIEIIDTITDKVSFGGYLSDSMDGTSAINIKNIIYAFGGRYSAGSSGVNQFFHTWQYIDLRTLSTTNPTTFPTEIPTTESSTNTALLIIICFLILIIIVAFILIYIFYKKSKQNINNDLLSMKFIDLKNNVDDNIQMNNDEDHNMVIDTLQQKKPSISLEEEYEEKDVIVAPSELNATVNDINHMHGEIDGNENDDFDVKKWFSDKIKLEKFYKEKYLNIFIKEGINNIYLIKSLTVKELKDIGIHKLGHRKMIISEAKNL